MVKKNNKKQYIHVDKVFDFTMEFRMPPRKYIYF